MLYASNPPSDFDQSLGHKCVGDDTKLNYDEDNYHFLKHLENEIAAADRQAYVEMCS
jgi:hypothetical protein